MDETKKEKKKQVREKGTLLNDSTVKQHTFVPVFLGRPNEANQSPPLRHIVCKEIFDRLPTRLM